MKPVEAKKGPDAEKSNIKNMAHVFVQEQQL